MSRRSCCKSRSRKKAIEAIGEVTLEDEKAIKAVRTAYDSLSKEEKAKVENYDKLKGAEEALAELKVEAEKALKELKKDKDDVKEDGDNGKTENTMNLSFFWMWLIGSAAIAAFIIIKKSLASINSLYKKTAP